MLSLRRQVSPCLCHRATPSSPRTLPSSRCRPALRPWPPRSRSHVSEWPLPGLAQRLSCMLGMCWLGPCLDSAEPRRLRRGHRPHATPRYAPRLRCSCCGPACAARPVRDTERTVHLGPWDQRCGGCAPESTVTNHTPLPSLALRLLLRLRVCQLGPSGTERTARLGSRLLLSDCGAQRPRRTTPTTATPATNEQRPRRTTPATNNARDEQRSRRTTPTPTSTLGSALRWPCHGGHRSHAASHVTTASCSCCGPACASSAR